eukprot:COSAG06_NODE_316_length_17668_cov_19.142410_4_plen_48_part_00
MPISPACDGWAQSASVQRESLETASLWIRPEDELETTICGSDAYRTH